jgi:hypothetical protein
LTGRPIVLVVVVVLVLGRFPVRTSEPLSACVRALITPKSTTKDDDDDEDD